MSKEKRPPSWNLDPTRKETSRGTSKETNALLGTEDKKATILERLLYIMKRKNALKEWDH